jgi:hypothetical protein
VGRVLVLAVTCSGVALAFDTTKSGGVGDCAPRVSMVQYDDNDLGVRRKERGMVLVGRRGAFAGIDAPSLFVAAGHLCLRASKQRKREPLRRLAISLLGRRVRG